MLSSGLCTCTGSHTHIHMHAYTTQIHQEEGRRREGEKQTNRKEGVESPVLSVGSLNKLYSLGLKFLPLQRSNLLVLNVLKRCVF